MDHPSKLCNELIKFRNAVKPKTLTTPGMHYNYQTLAHAFKLYDRGWGNLRSNGNNYDKLDLVWRQVIGYLQRALLAVDHLASSNYLCISCLGASLLFVLCSLQQAS